MRKKTNIMHPVRARDRAQRWLEVYFRHERRGQLRRAAHALRMAIQVDPAWHVPHYNLGLLAKYQGRWLASLQSNQKATQLDPTNEAAWWNMGIAATALGHWATAVQAWQGFGLKLEAHAPDAETDFPCGTGPIRLKHNGEVVWSNRLDPARAKITSIPTQSSGRSYGDVVLNDGAPNGYRVYQEQQYAVLDELQLLQPSGFTTQLFKLESASATAVEQLEQACVDKGFGFENWSTSLQWLCRQCSEGSVHVHHDQDLAESHVELVIAAPDQASITNVFDNWQREHTAKVIENHTWLTYPSKQ